MPTVVIDGRCNADPVLIDRIYRLRYRVFKEHMGWEVESLCGREIDRFDTEDAVYGAVADESGNLQGCFRLLPTTGPYMLKEVFPELLHGQTAPEDTRVLESSRFAVLPEHVAGSFVAALYAATARLLALQITYCLERGVRTVVSVTDIRFERVLKGAGLRCERFGPPLGIGTTQGVAGFMHPTEENLASVKDVLRRLDEKRASARAHLSTSPLGPADRVAVD
jgi:acyl homoserine lactone synthase